GVRTGRTDLPRTDIPARRRVLGDEDVRDPAAGQRTATEVDRALEDPDHHDVAEAIDRHRGAQIAGDAADALDRAELTEGSGRGLERGLRRVAAGGPEVVGDG